MGCHSQQKFTFSKFWELEVWDQDTNIVRFGRGSFSLLASGQILLVCLVKFPLVSLLLRTLFFCNIIAVVQSLSHVWLCNLMKYNMPGFPVLHYLQICSDSHPLSQWCHPTILPTVAYFSFCPRSFLVSRSFPMSQLFASGGQSIGALALASVFPMTVQGWFPLGLTFFDLLAVNCQGNKS